MSEVLCAASSVQHTTCKDAKMSLADCSTAKPKKVHAMNLQCPNVRRTTTASMTMTTTTRARTPVTKQWKTLQTPKENPM